MFTRDRLQMCTNLNLDRICLHGMPGPLHCTMFTTPWWTATLGGIILKAKNEKEVGAKYAQYCKEAALLNSFLSSNNGN